MSGSTGRASFYLSGARLLLYRIALSIGARGSWAGGVDANTAFSQLVRRRGAYSWSCRSMWRVLPKTPALPASWARAAAARHFVWQVTRGTCFWHECGCDERRVEGRRGSWPRRTPHRQLKDGAGASLSATLLSKLPRMPAGAACPQSVRRDN